MTYGVRRLGAACSQRAAVARHIGISDLRKNREAEFPGLNKVLTGQRTPGS